MHYGAIDEFAVSNLPLIRLILTPATKHLKYKLFSFIFSPVYITMCFNSLTYRSQSPLIISCSSASIGFRQELASARSFEVIVVGKFTPKIERFFEL